MIRFVLLVLAPIFVLCGHCFAAPGPQKPNLVIVVADDAGWGDFSFNGNTNLRTPSIDSLG